MLHVETSMIQVKDNGTCSVFKAEGITVNYYTKATTLQIQGKDIANKLRAQLVSQALNQTENDINQSALHTSFLAYESEQEQECQDGGENSSNSSSGGYINSSPNVTCFDSKITASSSGEDSLSANYFHSQIAAIKDELKTIKSLLKPANTNTSAEATISKLHKENEHLRFELTAANERYKNQSLELDSLKLVVQMISKDLLHYKSNTSVLPTTIQQDHSTSRREEEKLQRPEKDAIEVDNTMNPDSSPSTLPARIKSSKTTTTTVILGDSIVQNLQGFKLGKETKQRVVVKTFRGATTQDMQSYIQPTINSAPDQICLHVGTNDLKSKAPNEVADAIVDLARDITKSCKARVIISELTTRKDSFKDSVKDVNKLLNKYCKQNQWTLVRHSNISDKSLNRGGLHLNKQGNENLHKNFVKCLFKVNN